MQYHITNLNREINDLGRVINQPNLLSEIIMNKKISAVIPVYNSEKTLAQCLESVLSQTYENFETLS